MKIPNLTDLQSSVSGTASAWRIITNLAPAGGDADKVFPPTYATDGRGDKYAKEVRVTEGRQTPTVLLDSVQSQANRHEQALLLAIRDARLSLPLLSVDLSTDFPDIGEITALDAPHRIADAIFRDSLLGEVAFRQSEIGQQYSRASVRNANVVLETCPTALVFGVWDSTGEAGGSGNKFQRTLVSEIVGFGCEIGTKTSSRIDPLHIERHVTIYEAANNGWTTNPEEAIRDNNGQPKLKKGGEKDGLPSGINHGNIAPSIEPGGVTLDHAKQVTVLSLPAIRRLRFPGGEGAAMPAREHAARTYLTALGLASVALAREQGYDLRSRCLLVPDPAKLSVLECIQHDGSVVQYAVPTGDQAITLLNEAAEAWTKYGVLRHPNDLRLTPSPMLIDLIRRSRAGAQEPEGTETATPARGRSARGRRSPSTSESA
jgi:CRISPR-associated protein Csb1